MTAPEFIVRVWVEDVWDTVRVAADPEWPVNFDRKPSSTQPDPRGDRRSGRR